MRELMRALSLTIACGFLALCIYAQTFEVASIRKSSDKALKAKGRTGGPGTTTPDQISWRRRPLGLLVMEAYGIEQNSRLRGPGRIMPPDAPLWDIQATLPTNTKAEDGPKMLQVLLTDRFGLKVHWVTEERTIYHLTAAKGGVKVKLGESDEQRGYATIDTASGGGLHVVRYNMEDVARLAESNVGEPGAIVQNETGLTGVFTADLAFDNFKTALEQDWGLKLDRGKGPVQILVVDSIRDEPTEN
jgi:uncharacterized protein (TIGR03435 family)